MGELNTLADLKQDPENARQHNPRNIGMIERALQEVGAARSVVVNGDNVILAGNGVYEAAVAAGIENVQIVEADGNTIIAVKRSNLTPEQEKRLALFDNRTAELADWNVEQIVADLENGLDLDGIWNDNELAQLMGNFDPTDPLAEWDGMPEFKQDDLSAFRTILVHFNSQEDVDAFAQLVGQTITEKTRYIWYPKQERANLLAVECQDEP